MGPFLGEGREGGGGTTKGKSEATAEATHFDCCAVAVIVAALRAAAYMCRFLFQCMTDIRCVCGQQQQGNIAAVAVVRRLEFRSDFEGRREM